MRAHEWPGEKAVLPAGAEQVEMALAEAMT